MSAMSRLFTHRYVVSPSDETPHISDILCYSQYNRFFGYPTLLLDTELLQGRKYITGTAYS